MTATLLLQNSDVGAGFFTDLPTLYITDHFALLCAWGTGTNKLTIPVAGQFFDCVISESRHGQTAVSSVHKFGCSHCCRPIGLEQL